MNNILKNKKVIFPKLSKGFTLVEALVAISIILIGVTAASSAARTGVSSTNGVRDQVTAMFLAQEAMEGVRNMRESNMLENYHGTPTDWMEGIFTGNNGPCDLAHPCGYDIFDSGNNLSGSLHDCTTISNCAVKVDDVGGTEFYRQMSAPGLRSTGFIRQIFLYKINSGYETFVKVVITRTDSNFRFEINDILYDWF